MAARFGPGGIALEFIDTAGPKAPAGFAGRYLLGSAEYLVTGALSGGRPQGRGSLRMRLGQYRGVLERHSPERRRHVVAVVFGHDTAANSIRARRRA